MTRLGMTAILMLGAWSPFADAAAPSFDCAKAESTVEEAICASDQLAALDQEVTRLYRLATKTPDIDPARLNDLKAFQRGWIKGRDECWKSSLDLDVCIAQSYAFRIAELRTEFSHARSEDGASDGPYPYVCEGLNYPLSVAFIDAPELMVAVTAKDLSFALPVTRAASGVRYSDETTTFWLKGDDALYTTAEGETLECRKDDAG